MSGLLDSNVWFYAFVDDRDLAKHRRAKELIDRNVVDITMQIVGEVSNALLRKTELLERDIRTILRSFFATYQPILLKEASHLTANTMRERYHFSHWDSLIVVAALESSASILYSEDMQDGLVVEGTLRIVNPCK